MQRMIRRQTVEQETGLTCSTIYRLMADGDFPKPVPIGPRAVAWLLEDIEAWQQARIAERDARAA